MQRALGRCSLDKATIPESKFRASSGLSQKDFKTAVQLLGQAVSEAAAQPRTPSKRRISGVNKDSPLPLSASKIHTPPSGRSGERTPGSSQKELMDLAKAVQSGAAFGVASSSSGPSTPSRSAGKGHSATSASSTSPATPTHRKGSTVAASPGSHASTPKSVRFDDQAAKSAVHPYTPSKRSRLGPGAAESKAFADAMASSSSTGPKGSTPRSHRSLAVEDEEELPSRADDDDEEDDEGSFLDSPSSSRASKRSRIDFHASTGSSKARHQHQRLPLSSLRLPLAFPLQPLDPVCDSYLSLSHLLGSTQGDTGPWQGDTLPWAGRGQDGVMEAAVSWKKRWSDELSNTEGAEAS